MHSIGAPTPAPVSSDSPSINPQTATDLSKLVPPPINGSLPVSKADYEKLPANGRTAALDFLILGIIPAEEAVLNVADECLKLGEPGALEFLFRESGRSPEGSTVTLQLTPNWTSAGLSELVGYCKAHSDFRLMINLSDGLHSSVIPHLETLVKYGNVEHLRIDGKNVSAQQITQLAASFGSVGELFLKSVNFNDQIGKLFGDSLSDSARLKKLVLKNCIFGDSSINKFVEGMQKNSSVSYLEMQFTPTGVTPSAYQAILEKNTGLQRLNVVTDIRSGDVEGIIAGAISHPSLESIKVNNPFIMHSINFPADLNNLLERNHVLGKLSIDAYIKSADQYASMAEALRKNKSLVEFSLRNRDPMPDDVRKSMEDTLARNRALRDFQLLANAGHVFNPDNQLANGMADAGFIIAQHVLTNSSSVEEFAQTMANVEIAMREAVNQSTVKSSASSTTTATATTATTTTTTTTTQAAPPGPASS